MNLKQLILKKLIFLLKKLFVVRKRAKKTEIIKKMISFCWVLIFDFVSSELF